MNQLTQGQLKAEEDGVERQDMVKATPEKVSYADLVQALHDAEFAAFEFGMILSYQDPGAVRRNPTGRPLWPGARDYRDIDLWPHALSRLASAQATLQRLDPVHAMGVISIPPSPEAWLHPQDAAEAIPHTDDALAHTQALLIALGLEVVEQVEGLSPQPGVLVQGLRPDGFLQQLLQTIHRLS